MRANPRSIPMFVVAVAAYLSASPSIFGQRDEGLSIISPRIVHHFDFDERAGGNLEDVPKFWTPLVLERFPRFAVGAFDFDIDHTHSPSFRLDCSGRSVAYEYTGPATPVRPATDYRIEAYIRTKGLTHARACLSGAYLDRRGHPIRSTVARSRFIGDVVDGDGWTRVELHLPEAPASARTIGVTAWIMQEDQWNPGLHDRFHIPRNDVHGAAWFDDVSILALPKVELSTDSPGHVLAPGGAQHLRVLLADYENVSLFGRLSIYSATGELVEAHRVTPVIGSSGTQSIVPVGHLSPGLYHAVLNISAGDMRVLSRHLTFARLSAPYTDRRSASTFGVVVDAEHRGDGANELALLQNLLVRSVKLPVWSGLAEDDPTPAQVRGNDNLLKNLIKSGLSLIGVFAGPPGAIARQDGRFPRPLLQLLADHPDVWRDHLASVVVPYVGTFHWWQVGTELSNGLVHSQQLSAALGQLRTAMGQFMTVPRLAIPFANDVELASTMQDVDQITLVFSQALAPEMFADAIQRAKDMGYQVVSAYVEPLPLEPVSTSSEDRSRSVVTGSPAGNDSERDGASEPASVSATPVYGRIPALADFAQRLIRARHGGADTVFTRQPWSVRETPRGKVTEPIEPYLALRTIADVLAGTTPGQVLRMAPGVDALVFHDGSKSVVALWDSQAPRAGREHSVQLGSATRVIDLWGNETPLRKGKDGRHIIRLSPTPVFVDRIERWVIDFRTSLRLTPDQVETGTELQAHVLAFDYDGTTALAGLVKLSGADDWEILPHEISFHLAPKGVERFPVEVRYPHSTVAGPQRFIARVRLASSGYAFVVPLVVNFGLSDVDVWASAARDGRDLVLTHSITNRSSKTIHMRGTASVRGRQRQYRPFGNVQPGKTLTVEYRFSNATPLRGSKVRLVVRELDDGPRIHTLALRVP